MSENEKPLPSFSVSELMAEYDRKAALPITDPDNPDGFEWDDENKGWCIWWGKYEYFVEDARIRTAENLLGWVSHIGAKSWEHSTSSRIANWVEAVAARKGWKIHA